MVRFDSLDQHTAEDRAEVGKLLQVVELSAHSLGRDHLEFVPEAGRTPIAYAVSARRKSLDRP